MKSALLVIFLTAVATAEPVRMESELTPMERTLCCDFFGLWRTLSCGPACTGQACTATCTQRCGLFGLISCSTTCQVAAATTCVADTATAAAAATTVAGIVISG
uniref:Uncharacterized protein n=1 Tax=Pseudodiaptomus poplesia TaxID=213370 RepID=A0A1S6GL95_9MAXI|nr:hypothetical protein [Pseudodiaptomus poplesia]